MATKAQSGRDESIGPQKNSPLLHTSSTLTPPQTFNARFLNHVKAKFVAMDNPKPQSIVLGSPVKNTSKKESSKISLSKRHTLSPTLIKRKREDFEDLLRSAGDQDEVPEPEESPFSDLKAHRQFSEGKHFPATVVELQEKYKVSDFRSSHCSIDDIDLDPRNYESSYESNQSSDDDGHKSEEKDDIDTIVDVNKIIDNIRVPSFNEFVREREDYIEKKRESTKRYSIPISCFLGLPFAERVDSLKKQEDTIKEGSRLRISSFEIR